MLRTSLSLLLVPAVVMVAAPSARADTVDRAARNTARKLGQEALKLYDTGDYAPALEKLDTANSLVPTPTLGLYAARCLAKLGRLVEAAERYLEVSRMQLERHAPPLMKKALVEAVAERDKLLPTIPTLEVRLEGPQGEGVTVIVDGKPFLLGLLGERRSVDPGRHSASAKRADAEVSREVNVKPSQAAQIVLTLPPLPPPPVERTPPLRTAGWVGIGVGVAGAVLGVVAGSIALADQKHLDTSKSCYQFICNATESGTLSRYHVVTKLTTAGLLTGLVGLGFGIPVLVVTPKTELVNADGSRVAPPKDTTKAKVEPWVTVGGAGLRGVFW